MSEVHSACRRVVLYFVFMGQCASGDTGTCQASDGVSVGAVWTLSHWRRGECVCASVRESVYKR